MQIIQQPFKLDKEGNNCRVDTNICFKFESF